MQEHLLFRRQFLLSRVNRVMPRWPEFAIGDYYLTYHPNLQCTVVRDATSELCLLGFFFDYRNPDATDEEILMGMKGLLLPDLFKALSYCSGGYLLIARYGESISVIPDACAQKEIFYDDTFTAICSQPILLEKVVEGKGWKDKIAADFFQSEAHRKSGTYLLEYTNRENIRKLLPNHYADLQSKQVIRFFPYPDLQLHAVKNKNAVDEIVTEVVEMFKGYLLAASKRYPLEIGLSAGADSRLLFLCMPDLPYVAFVEKRRDERSKSAKRRKSLDLKSIADVKTALALGKHFQHEVEFREMSYDVPAGLQEVMKASMDAPRFVFVGNTQSAIYSDSTRMLINGNLSEIARNFFRTPARINGQEFASIYRYKGEPFAAKRYDDWIRKNAEIFQAHGLHMMDMFYWEERMANWAGKAKTEWNYTQDVFSPFNAHRIFCLLLNTDRRLRDKYMNTLFHQLLLKASPRALDIPLNPASNDSRKRKMKRIGLYNVYIAYGMKVAAVKQWARHALRLKVTE